MAPNLLESHITPLAKRIELQSNPPTPKDAPGDVPDISREYETIGVTKESVRNRQSKTKWERL